MYDATTDAEIRALDNHTRTNHTRATGHTQAGAPELTVITAYGRNEPHYLHAAGCSIAELPMRTQWIIAIDDPAITPDDLTGLPANPLVLPTPHQHPAGPGAARNRALTHASAPWTLICDSDDTLNPAGISELLATATTEQCTWIAARAHDITPDGHHLWDGPPDTYPPGPIPAGQYLVDLITHDAVPFVNNTVAMRTRALQRIGGWPEHLRREDTAMLAALTSHHDGYWLPVLTYHYRQHPRSITAQPDWATRDREYIDMVQLITATSPHATTRPITRAA